MTLGIVLYLASIERLHLYVDLVRGGGGRGGASPVLPELDALIR